MASCRPNSPKQDTSTVAEARDFYTSKLATNSELRNTPLFDGDVNTSRDSSESRDWSNDTRSDDEAAEGSIMTSFPAKAVCRGDKRSKIEEEDDDTGFKTRLVLATSFTILPEMYIKYL